MTPHAASRMSAPAHQRRVKRQGFQLFLSPIRSVVTAIRQEMRLRRDEHLLAQMADIELLDMGLHRSQISDAVRNGRVSHWESDC
jgi:uncharacterized protein YjiS (DUF1127 family)